MFIDKINNGNEFDRLNKVGYMIPTIRDVLIDKDNLNEIIESESQL